MKQTPLRYSILSLGLALLALAAGLGLRQALAGGRQAAAAQAAVLHPTFALLDAEGRNVLESGRPVSPMTTCGQCHDTAYIAAHNFHSDLGVSGPDGAQPWDTSLGLFGQWDPLTYRYLSQPGDERLDLSTAGWIQANARFLVGGGPATETRDGRPLAVYAPSATNVEASILDPRTGEPLPWDWQKSGTLELNCFLCHLTEPDNDARIIAIRAGQFQWAATATLRASGLVSQNAGRWVWNPKAFDADGLLLPEYVTVQDPSNANCAQCHGVVHTDVNQPLTLPACNDLTNPQTATTGQVFSPQRMSVSGVNLTGKQGLTRSWDVHAERQVDCVDCHFSLNNPIYYFESLASRPGHLIFDPRRLDLGEYLKYPDHNLARGQSAQYNLAPELKGTMRRCESCHDAANVHRDWLPYVERHLSVLACESCHIPQLYAPAIQSYDWTVINEISQPAVTCRGVDGTGASPADLVSGYEPVWMPRTNVDGQTMLAPYNLITAWYWVYDDPQGGPRPVRLYDLQAAYLENGRYAPEIVAAFDGNADGRVDASELVIDTDLKRDVVAARLAALGLANPRIEGQVQPYSINHGVARDQWVLTDCRACHSDSSRVTQPIRLADRLPGGVTPAFVPGTNVSTGGQIYTDADGALYYRPSTDTAGRYIFGHDRVAWVDWLGGIFFLGVLAAVAGHGGLRWWSARRQARQHGRLRRVYMYQAYERLWHWLQTLGIVLLLFSGLVIRRPDMFGLFNYHGMVVMHNVLAVLLALNAALSLFYHLASGQIRQYLPRPYGLFDQAIVQARYYLSGIFKRQPHPFEKTPDRKLNPLQQLTYLAILNVLLPLQGLTGILMWGVQRWPQYADLLGGLRGLASFHSLIAWLFAAFIVAHVYLTTTSGHTPTAAIQAMVTGWEEVEVGDHAGEPEKKEKKS